MAKVILISGASRSGKSSLAAKLTKHLPGCISIDIDDFILPERLLPRVKDRIDWEKPETIDWSKLTSTVSVKGRNHNYVVVEGIFALSNKSLIEMADYVVSLEIDKPTFLKRRKLETRWGEEPDWFLEHVWESHLKYHNPHQVTPNIVMTDPVALDHTKLIEEIKSL